MGEIQKNYIKCIIIQSRINKQLRQKVLHEETGDSGLGVRAGLELSCEQATGL